MTPEQKAAIEQEAETLYPDAEAPTFNVFQAGCRQGFIDAATKYTEQLEQKDKEIESLKKLHETDLLRINKLSDNSMKLLEEIYRLNELLSNSERH